MDTKQPPGSGLTVEQEQHALVLVTLWIDRTLASMELPADEKSRLVLGCFDVAIEHQRGVAVLGDQGLYGPMFALVRVLFESVARGLWLSECASEKQIAEFKKGRLDRSFGDLIGDIEKSLGNVNGPLSRLKRDSWKFMNDFTHTGIEQVFRRNSATSTGGNYPPEEIKQALTTSGALGLLAAALTAGTAKNAPLTQKVQERIKEYAARAAQYLDQ